ncbi:MAG: DUF3857 domain-containing protein, partial [Marinoscillum sp.]
MKKLQIVILASILLLVNTPIVSQPNKKEKPSWVKSVGIDNDQIKDASAGFQYLLFDAQDNISTEEAFRHYAIKVLNSEGIQAMSEISAVYDPTYQNLTFHSLYLIREGKKIDKLDEAEIFVYQRETNMERSLYDGSETAVIHLSDVRSGDVIVYSYSVKGFNPINKGHFTNSYYTQLAIPINKIYVSLQSPRALYFKTYEKAEAPSVNRLNGLYKYELSSNGLDNLVFDNNVPSWYDPLKRISFSTYEKWSEVVDWSLPLYGIEEKNVPSIDLSEHESLESEILALIRIVQDEIRYLGLEQGISAYLPNSPHDVFEQRYGDCKDKSLLLVGLLRKNGVEAFPVLVNTALRSELVHQIPGNAFDHCVVGYMYNGEMRFVDPTISSQGGDLENLHFPDYQYGLIVKQGEINLTKL